MRNWLGFGACARVFFLIPLLGGAARAQGAAGSEIRACADIVAALPPASLAELSQALMAEGQVSRALETAEQALAARPNDVESFKAMILPLRTLSRSSEARAFLDRWLTHEPTSPSALAMVAPIAREIENQALDQRLAKLKSERKFDRAFAVARKAAGDNPGIDPYLSQTAFFGQLSGRWQDALDALNKLKLLRPLTGGERRTEARSRAATDLDFALAPSTAEHWPEFVLEGVVAYAQSHPRNVEALKAVIEVFRRQGRLDEGLYYARERLVLEPSSVEARQAFIDARLDRLKNDVRRALTSGRADDALALVDEASEELPDEVWPKAERIFLLRSLGRKGDARAYLDSLKSQGPLSDGLIEASVRFAFETGDWRTALDELDEMADRGLQVSAALLSYKSEILSKLREFEEALEAAEGSLKIEPGLPRALLARGNALLGLERANEAIEIADAVFNGAESFHYRALDLKARSLGFLMRWPEMHAVAEAMTEMQPDKRRGWEYLARARMRMRAFARALTAIRRAIDIKTSGSYARSIEVEALGCLEQFDQAWGMVSRMRPSLLRARTEVQLLIAQGRKNDAEVLLKSLPADRVTAWSRAELAVAAGRMIDARARLLDVLKLSKTVEQRRLPIAGLIKLSLMEDPSGRSLTRLAAKSDPEAWASALDLARSIEWRDLSAIAREIAGDNE